MEFQYNLLRHREAKVTLNVYDLHTVNYYLHSIGLGIYHTGIQIYDVEYSFGSHEGSSTGVYECQPKTSFPEGSFRLSIELGTSTLSPKEIISALDQLKSEYSGKSYNLILRNCNNFSNDVSLKLLGKGIPSYINRLACLGTFVKCLIPKEFMKGPSEDASAAPGYAVVNRSGAKPNTGNGNRIYSFASLRNDMEE